MNLDVNEKPKKKRKAVDGRSYDAHTMQVLNGHIEKAENGRLFSAHILPVDRLFGMEILTVEGHGAGMDIISLREVALSPVGIARMRYTQEFGVALSEIDPLTMYARIMRKLKPYESHLVERFCFEMVREPDYGWAKLCRKSIQESFDALAKALDDVRNIGKLNSEEGKGVSSVSPDY